MEILFEKRGKTLIAHLKGELDQHCAAAVRKSMDAKVRAAGNTETLILDLGEVGFMDSSGIGVILGRYRLMRDLGGELIITNAPKTLDKLLKLSGVYGLLENRRRERANG